MAVHTSNIQQKTIYQNVIIKKMKFYQYFRVFLIFFFKEKFGCCQQYIVQTPPHPLFKKGGRGEGVNFKYEILKKKGGESMVRRQVFVKGGAGTF